MMRKNLINSCKQPRESKKCKKVFQNYQYKNLKPAAVISLFLWERARQLKKPKVPIVLKASKAVSSVIPLHATETSKKNQH